MTRQHLSLSLYGLLIFGGGLAVGAMGHRLYSANAVSAVTRPPAPEEWRTKFVGEMKSRVGLDAQQLTQLDAVLDESRELFHQVREKYRPEMKAIYDSQVTKIKSILKDSQQAEYAKILEEQKRAREKRDRRP